MRILFLTHYYPPEVNAPAVRTRAHCRQWAAHGHEVHVITCFPSHPAGRVYEGYRMGWYRHEVVEGVHVHRIPTWIAANEGFLGRILNYLSFVPSAWWRSLRLPRPDVIIATSPQFFVAVAGRLSALTRRVPWIFEVRDLWPASIEAVGAMRAGWRLRLLEKLELHLYRSAMAVVVVTRSFVEDLTRRGIPADRLVYLPNGIDPDELDIDEARAATRRRELGCGPETVLVGYVGTVGLAHGVGALLDAAAMLEGAEIPVRFVIVGDGAERERLEERVTKRGPSNVTFCGQVPRGTALEILGAIDIATVLLRESPVFETVLPTKLLEAMGAGRPVVLGVRGEALDTLVNRARAGLAVPPDDARRLAEAIEELAEDPARRGALGERGRRFVRREFSREGWGAHYLEEIQRRLSPDESA